MINIDYNRETNTTKVSIGDTSTISKNCQLKLKFKNIISGEIHYQPVLGSNTWCTWCGAELITDVLFYDVDDNLIYEHKWDVMRDGDEIEKQFRIGYFRNHRHFNYADGHRDHPCEIETQKSIGYITRLIIIFSAA